MFWRTFKRDLGREIFWRTGTRSKYFFEELKGGTDPLSSDNLLIFATGPFTGTIVPCSGKLAIVAKSPLTGTIVDSSIGGTFAATLKYADFDLMIVQGQSAHPVYLNINNSKVEILDAGFLWRKGTYQTEEILHEKYGDRAAVLGIGPAGENLVAYSCIGSEKGRPGAVAWVPLWV